MTEAATIDIWLVIAVFVKAMTYAGGLVAAGGVLFAAIFKEAPTSHGPALRRLILTSVVAAAVATVFQVNIKAAMLAGDASGLADWFLIQMILGSPEGLSVVVRLSGLLLTLAIFTTNSRSVWIALVGAVLIWVSFGLVGHTPERGVIVSAILIVHLAAISYWIGALYPLLQLTACGDANLVSHILKKFGDLAALIVATLIIAGATLAWTLIGSFAAVFETGYGRTLLLKIVLVAALLLLAALNKWRLVPAFAHEVSGAPIALKRSIVAECVVAAAILLTTAALTTVTGPPIQDLHSAKNPLTLDHSPDLSLRFLGSAS